MRKLLLLLILLGAVASPAKDGSASMNGLASWYGEAHRGKSMANGDPFDPDQLTAASWFYPLGTRVRVSSQTQPERSVIVCITDHGPAKRLVEKGRIIDLARAAFERIAPLEVGLVSVSVQTAEGMN